MGKKYIKCPRCELNYILEGEDYCNVCKNEMKHHSENDDDELLDFEEMELCPVCGQNYIKEDETMCYECKGKGGADGSDDSDKDYADDSRISPENDVDHDDDDDDYNSGFGEVDENGNEIDPFKEGSSLLDDDVPIDFAGEEDELDELDEEISPLEDDFEVVEVSDDDEEDDEEDEDDYDFEDDLLGKKK